jgi:tetratricopeptide (TPR) repeat protein
MRKVHSKFVARQSILFGVICLFGAFLIIPVQNGIEKRLGDTGPDPDLLYFSSPSAVKRMALGYENILADIYWMRTIQYYGRRDEAAKRSIRYKNLAALLDITTSLDPDLMDAYVAGSFFLGENDPLGAGQPEEALKLLDKGIRAHPGEWRFLYYKGLVYYVYVDDFKAAGNTWLDASRMPEAPEYLEGLAAKSLSEGGAMDTARALWQRQYEEATRDDIRENAKNRLISLKVAEDIWALEFLSDVYRLENGMYPRSLSELISDENGVIRTVDPLGTPYSYDPETGSVSLNPQSQVLYLKVPESYKEDFLEKLFG